MNDLVSEYQQYQDASVDEEEFDEEEEAEDAEWTVLIAEIKMPRRQRERQKSNRFRLAKQQLCTRVTLFFLHFFTVTARLGREKALNMVVRNSAPEEFACISQSKRTGNTAIEIERTQIHFLSKVFVAVAVVVSLSPPYCCEIWRCFKLVISNFLFQACKEVRFVPY